MNLQLLIDSIVRQTTVLIAQLATTGALHLVPFWSQEFGRSRLSARQVSRRGAAFACRLEGARVRVAGAVAPYLEGEIDGP